MTNVEEYSGVLDHPLTLQIFIHFKKQAPNPVGIRETQRFIKVRTLSTINWHFNKLVEAGLIEQNSKRKFHLTESGLKHENLEIPMRISSQIILGRLVPRFSLILGVSVFGILFHVILFLMEVDRTALSYSLFMNLLLLAGLVFKEWLAFQDRFNETIDQKK